MKANWYELLKAFNAALEAELAGKQPWETGLTLEDATDALHKRAHQHLIDRGFGTSYGQHKAKEKALNQEIASLKAASRRP